jgi:hypothetical protein
VLEKRKKSIIYLYNKIVFHKAYHIFSFARVAFGKIFFLILTPNLLRARAIDFPKFENRLFGKSIFLYSLEFSGTGARPLPEPPAPSRPTKNVQLYNRQGSV